MDDHLGVALRPEDVAEARQLGNQFPIVVDLAVVHDDHAAVLVVERLLSRREVDDRESAMAQAEPGLEMQAMFVRPAMQLAFVHARYEIARDRPLAGNIEDADDATHGRLA